MGAGAEGEIVVYDDALVLLPEGRRGFLPTTGRVLRDVAIHVLRLGIFVFVYRLVVQRRRDKKVPDTAAWSPEALAGHTPGARLVRASDVANAELRRGRRRLFRRRVLVLDLVWGERVTLSWPLCGRTQRDATTVPLLSRPLGARLAVRVPV